MRSAVHHLQAIGEAAHGVSQPLKDCHPEVPWPQIVALRNILVHECSGLDIQHVWTMANKELPVLERQVRQIRTGRENRRHS